MALSKAVVTWLLGKNVGVSSQTIVAYMEKTEYNGSHPWDPHDFGRCLGLLKIAPKYKKRLKDMADLSPVWARLIENWDEIERLYNIWDKSNLSSDYDKCYSLMRVLIDPTYVKPTNTEVAEDNVDEDIDEYIFSEEDDISDESEVIDAEQKLTQRYEVELAVCETYGSDSGSWYVVAVQVEFEIGDGNENPSSYELLELAEDQFENDIGGDDRMIAAFGLYSYSKMIKCPACHEYYPEYEEECMNLNCPTSLYNEEAHLAEMTLTVDETVELIIQENQDDSLDLSDNKSDEE